MRGNVLSGEASRRSTSESASPIVLVPRSIPIRRALAGQARGKVFDGERAVHRASR